MTDGDDADAGAPRRTMLYGAIDLPDHHAPTQDADADAGASRRTMLYGAIDLPDHYPPTLAESMVMPTVAGPAVGELLVRYRIEDVLGRGGMGEVLSARDDQIGRSVAIKRLRVKDPSPDVLARFLREVRIQGRLEHPAIVPVYELWNQDESQPFFVMKQLAGTTLADLIPRLAAGERTAAEQFSLHQLLRAFVDVCLAIEFAHTHGVVHRDLKPANVVLGDFGEVYVLDWGIAHVVNEGEDRSSIDDIEALGGAETVAGAILGTPGYIAPEQIRGVADLDGRADIYALGCILFEILTLEPLHPRGQSAIASALGGVDARASLRAPGHQIPPELDAICVRATAMDREQRFATARQLGSAVQRFLDGNRDLVVRQELARSELLAAREAMADGTPRSRQTAMRSAARALALDPTNREAVDLVGRLMLEPPKETPPEVEAELAQMDRHAWETSTRFGTVGALAYLAFFPLLYWAGLRDLWYLIAGPAISAIIIIALEVLAPRFPVWPRYLAITGNLAMFALFSWLASPVVFGPGPPIILVTILAVHRRLMPVWLVAAVTSLAALSPWILSFAGVIGPLIWVSGGDLVLHTAASQLDATATIVGLMFYIVASAQLAALIGRLQDNERRAVRRAIQLQAWQLRQLVPRATTASSP
jgi:serine/threonine protein kinase